MFDAILQGADVPAPGQGRSRVQGRAGSGLARGFFGQPPARQQVSPFHNLNGSYFTQQICLCRQLSVKA